MLQFFRNFFSSRLGVAVTMGFVILVAIAFAGGDVASSGGFGGIAGGDRVATVGKARIDNADLERAASNAVEQLRQDDPKMTMKLFIDRGGLDQLLTNLIDLAAVREFGERHGIHVGDRLIDSEIAKIPAVQGPNGKVDDRLYQAFLNQRRITDAQLRRQIVEMLIARQLLTSSSIGVAVPQDAALRYAGLATEQRSGAIAILPSAAFAPKTPPSDGEVAAWYAKNGKDYQLPERRVIRYVTFDDSVLKSIPAPTEAEIAARYQANKAQFAATENRRITQLVVATEPAAKALQGEIAAGKTLEAASSAKGLSAASLGSVSKESLSSQTSQAVADAAFAADSGKVIGPIKAPLGWLLLRVDAVEGKAGRTLDQARGELVEQIAAEKRRAALTEFSAGIEEEFDSGSTLGDVAKTLGLSVSETPALTADGRVFGQPEQTAPALLARVIQPAFMMESENQAQLAEVEAGKRFVIFDVGRIEASAPPPLAQIRQAVATDVQLSKGAVAAKAAAQKVEAAVRKGTDLSTALAGLGVALPPIDRVEMGRQQYQAMGQQVPPPITVFFATQKGGVRLLGAPRNRGWYVVQVTNIVPGKVDPADPRLGGLKQNVASEMGDEYFQQLRAAMRKDVGVKRNQNAIAAVRSRLLGTN